MPQAGPSCTRFRGDARADVKRETEHLRPAHLVCARMRLVDGPPPIQSNRESHKAAALLRKVRTEQHASSSEVRALHCESMAHVVTGTASGSFAHAVADSCGPNDSATGICKQLRASHMQL